MYKNKVLLITGGTGSFGNAVLNKYLNSDIAEIRIFSRDEKKQDDMRQQYKSDKVKYYVGDVRDYASVSNAMNGVDYVFHAAALKQVPSCEFYPLEAVKTNVIGAENVIEASIQKEVKKVIVLSTDKAVYPINAMGMSKALMEKIMAAKSRNLSEEKTTLCATRYGNVMASRGSVIPLFIKLMQEKKYITITDPDMTRFLLHLDEAIELVEFAFSNAKQGDIFVKKAPACTIMDLAMALKKLLKSNSELRIIGTRHGEKLYETLVTKEEMVRAEDMGDFYRIPADTRDLNYKIFFTEGKKDVSIIDDYNSHNTKRLNGDEVANLLLTLDCVKEALAQ